MPLKPSLAYSQVVDITSKGLKYLEEEVPDLVRARRERTPEKYREKALPSPRFYHKAFLLERVKSEGPVEVRKLIHFEFEGGKWPKRALAAQRASEGVLNDLYAHGYIEDVRYLEPTKELK